jgi:chromate reductase, NAD(P)H dehydrogenase (quinone)
VPHILGISGSLRRASFNTSLLRAAIEVAPAGTTIDVGSIAEFPLYNADVEAAGVPAPVKVLKDQVAAADGLLIATPEYNNSIPGVAKNAIDWLSRPPSDVPKLFRNKKVAIMGATPGQGGTILSQAAWLPILATLGTLPYFGGRVRISNAATVFDANGKLVDEKIREQLKKFVEGFAAFCGKQT